MQKVSQQRSQLEIAGNADPLDFAIAQRDRMIALLEQEAVAMQGRLQREAAARRKAESAIKRAVETGGLSAAAREAWSQIDADTQVERLHRQINALRTVSLLERQRALAEISRYKKEIERLKGESSRRAA